MLPVMKITLDVFVNDEKFKEAGVAPRNCDEPWSNYRDVEDKRSEPRNFQQSSASAFQYDEAKDGSAGQHHGDRSFGQRSQG